MNPQTFRAILATSALISGLAIGNYFWRYLPNARAAELAEQQRGALLDKVRRCNADALKFSEKYRAETVSAANGGELTWFDPEMHFSGPMNTCLVALGWDEMLAGELVRSGVVLDVYGNHEIISTAYQFKGGAKIRSAWGSADVDEDPNVYDKKLATLFERPGTSH